MFLELYLNGKVSRFSTCVREKDAEVGLQRGEQKRLVNCGRHHLDLARGGVQFLVRCPSESSDIPFCRAHPVPKA